MVMMDGFASCLIKVRQHHIGFPSLFSHYPEGMKHEELTEIHDYVQNAMDQPREISEASGYLRRVIIGTGKYLVMGISGYAQHLAAEVQNVPHQLVDFTGRGCPGFIGFVWNLETTPVQQILFPSLSAFGSVFQELILEHWEDSKNSAWAYETRAGIEVPYKFSVSAEPLPIPGDPVTLNHNKKKIYSFDKSKENALIYQAVLEAVKKQSVSICTDLYFNDEEGSSFLNMTADLKGGPVVSLENARFMTAKTTQNQTANVEPEQRRTPVETDWEAGLNNIGTSEENNLNGGFGTSFKGIIQPREEPRSVLLKFRYGPCDMARQLNSQFIQQLVATYRNIGQEIDWEEILYQPSKNLVEIYIVRFFFSTPIYLEDFKKVCEGILGYFNTQKWVYGKENGQCFIKALNGWKEYNVFVAYKNFLHSPTLISGEEILLHDFRPAAKKPNSTRNGVPAKTKQQTPNTGSQVPTSNDPLIQQIKQNNNGYQAKKRSNDDDPFKCFE